jgi:hypothetical protein
MVLLGWVAVLAAALLCSTGVWLARGGTFGGGGGKSLRRRELRLPRRIEGFRETGLIPRGLAEAGLKLAAAFFSPGWAGFARDKDGLVEDQFAPG